MQCYDRGAGEGGEGVEEGDLQPPGQPRPGTRGQGRTYRGGRGANGH